MPTKIFVLDTNVLMHDPRAIFSFEDNDVIIPIVVIEELDNHKKGVEEKNRNARKVSRDLDELDKDNKLSQGVDLEGGGTLKIELNHQSPACMKDNILDMKIPDNRILATALTFFEDEKKKGEKGKLVVLITKDTNMRIKARAFGLRAEDYEHDKEFHGIDELYSGETEISVDPGTVTEAYEKGEVEISGTFHPNQCVLLKNNANADNTALMRYVEQGKKLIAVKKNKSGVFGVHSKNKQQSYALDLLMDESISLVTLVGKAGTGKTMLALAAGLEQTIEQRKYSRLVVARPVIEMGKGIGFLPGDMDEKLRPWMQPIRDNLDLLIGSSSRPSGRAAGKNELQSLFELGMIEVEPLAMIRGRSMPKLFFIIDEAQNLTRHEIKTIITRAGEGTKIILTGDPYQIDNPYIDSTSNGLSIVAETFKDQKTAGHITLLKGERSDLAELAATLL